MLLEALKLAFLAVIMFLLFVALSFLNDIDYKLQQYINYAFIHMDNTHGGNVYES